MPDPPAPDPKTAKLFELLELTDPAKRAEYVHMASSQTLESSPLPAHFRLDALTTSLEPEADAELA